MINSSLHQNIIAAEGGWIVTFKDSQVMLPDSAGLKKAKDELKRRLLDLSATLDEYLAFQYGVEPKKEKEKFQIWKTTHQPFHWWVEFYEVLYDDDVKFKGFDVVIGNPPYVEYAKTRKEYRILGLSSEISGNLFAFISERSNHILQKRGRLSFIVPISLVCTKRMESIQNIAIKGKAAWLSNYAERPGKLFSGAEVILTIFLVDNSAQDESIHVTGFNKWNTEERAHLFQRISYTIIKGKLRQYIYPKISNSIEVNISDKLFNRDILGKAYVTISDSKVYYRIGGGRYWKIFSNFQPKFFLNGKLSNYPAAFGGGMISITALIA